MLPGDPDAVLLLCFPEAPNPLAVRLRHMGFTVQEAGELDEAVAILRRADPVVGAVLLPCPCPLSEPRHALGLLAELSPGRTLRFVFLGGPSGASERAALRAACDGLALWEPFTEGELRFVLNHALYNARHGEARRAVRVPTRMLARVQAGTGEKDALVYSLSEEGAFLETPRPSQPGSSLELELPLPSALLRTRARVLAANVPGSTYRRQVPKGMGVRFSPLEPDAREHLERYIETRARAFQL